MNTEDFVMLRRYKGDTSSNERPGTPLTKSRDNLTGHRGGRSRGVGHRNLGGQERGGSSVHRNTDTGIENKGMEDGEIEMGTRNGNRWVRFLDVAVTAPSDDSDDELDFCKPGANTNTNTNKQSKDHQQQGH